MKKSLSIVLCALMVALTLCSCKFVKSDAENASESTAAVQNAGGKSKKSDKLASDKKDTSDKSSKDSFVEITVNVTDKNGKPVTNKDGSKKTEKVTVLGDPTAIYITDKNGDYVTNKDGTPKTEKFDINKFGSEVQKQFEEQAKKTTTKKAGGGQNSGAAVQSAEEDLLPEGSKEKDTTLVKTVIMPVIKTGTYTIKGNIKAEGQSIGATLAFRNSKDYSFEASMMGMSFRMFSNGGKYYMALPSFGWYSQVSSEEADEMSVDDVSGAINDKNAKYVKTTSVKSGKTTYTCEEYETSSGTTKYYFDSNKAWKRMENISKDGTIIVWEITTFAKTAEAKLFEVNKLWKENKELENIFG